MTQVSHFLLVHYFAWNRIRGCQTIRATDEWKTQITHGTIPTGQHQIKTQEIGTWGYISDRGTKWEYAKINTILPTGEAEVTGTNTLTKIGGVDGYNTGGSSTNFIGGESNGYFQFQLSGMMKIGVVYEDIDYNVSNPFSWKFLQTQYSHVLTSTSMPFTDGDWFRIRHYASENEIHFQRKQEVFGEDNESIGQGYVTEFIHPTSTNGNDLFLDVSLREIGASVNDPKIAR